MRIEDPGWQGDDERAVAGEAGEAGCSRRPRSEPFKAFFRDICRILFLSLTYHSEFIDEDSVYSVSGAERRGGGGADVER